ncbi:MAG: hypothetical protein HRT89_12985 [Lentisphaeria bacterium]|nr:hypothetical protein [Lentisphaeria bacterium]NQZ68973.1 hypothetical protein [Lentisphaeria bacterium]
MARTQCPSCEWKCDVEVESLWAEITCPQCSSTFIAKDLNEPNVEEGNEEIKIVNDSEFEDLGVQRNINNSELSTTKKKMAMNAKFRWVGVIGLILGLICRIIPSIVLTSSITWTGKWELLKWFIYLDAFADIMNIAILVSALLIVLSYTSIVEKQEFSADN